MITIISERQITPKTKVYELHHENGAFICQSTKQESVSQVKRFLDTMSIYDFENVSHKFRVAFVMAFNDTVRDTANRIRSKNHD